MLSRISILSSRRHLPPPVTLSLGTFFFFSPHSTAPNGRLYTSPPEKGPSLEGSPQALQIAAYRQSALHLLWTNLLSRGLPYDAASLNPDTAGSRKLSSPPPLAFLYLRFGTRGFISPLVMDPHEIHVRPVLSLPFVRNSLSSNFLTLRMFAPMKPPWEMLFLQRPFTFPLPQMASCSIDESVHLSANKVLLKSPLAPTLFLFFPGSLDLIPFPPHSI